MSALPRRDPAPAVCDAPCPLAGSSVPLAHAAGASAAAMGRRVFISRAALAAAGAALAACGGGGGDSPTAPASVGPTLTLADYPALAAVGGVATVTIGGAPLAIVRTGASSFLALSRSCPHAGTTVDVTSTGFHCPNHGATFDRTGRWIGGQGTSNLRARPTTYDAAAGTLTVG